MKWNTQNALNEGIRQKSPSQLRWAFSLGERKNRSVNLQTQLPLRILYLKQS